MIPPEEIKAMRERCEAATPGPWTIHGNNIFSPDHIFLAGPRRHGEAIFFHGARQDLPRLLDALEWAYERIEHLEQRLGRESFEVAKLRRER